MTLFLVGAFAKKMQSAAARTPCVAVTLAARPAVSTWRRGYKAQVELKVWTSDHLTIPEKSRKKPEGRPDSYHPIGG